MSIVRPFETDRTRRHREDKLSKFNEEEITNIEKFGCQVLSVALSEASPPGFSYTIGVYDTCGHPELIVVALPFQTAHALLNEAAGRLRRGIDLTQGRHVEMVGEVDCEFRPVAPKWAKHLMLGANWFYRGTGYPVLQAVYPDLENRFPEDPDFDGRFIQPLLQTESRATELEEAFWKATE
jgi:Domain of unknown function (DUF4262)